MILSPIGLWRCLGQTPSILMGLIQMRNTQMKKIVLILSASFSSISAFANEDFASNEIANDEIISQTFAPGANKEIAALSTEEMQNTKGAGALHDAVTTYTGLAVLGSMNWSMWRTHALSWKYNNGQWASSEDAAKAGVRGIPVVGDPIMDVYEIIDSYY